MPLFVQIVGVLVVVGGVVRIMRIARAHLRRNRAQKYLHAFMAFKSDSEASSHSDDFIWLVNHAGRVQKEMMHAGAIESQPVAVGDVYLPRQISLSDALAEMSDHTESQHYVQVREALVRYVSLLSDQISGEYRAIINPLNWYGTGVLTLLLLPPYLFWGLGIVEKNPHKPASSGRLLKFLASLMAIGLLFLAIASLVWGQPAVIERLLDAWQQFLRIFPG